MNRTRRILWHVVTVVSLLLCVATVVLWVRSYWVTDTISFWHIRGTQTEHTAFSGYPGVIYVGRSGSATGYWSPPPDRPIVWQRETSHGRWDYGFARRAVRWSFARFVWLRSDHSELWTRLLVVPFWCPALIFAAGPAAFALGWRRRRARRPGLCPSCGYDLRATPDRCPECGTMPTDPTPARVES